LISELTDISILACDQDLLIIDKPAGLLSLPDGYDPALPHVKSVLSQTYGPLWIVHRLDRPTSGVMVLARNAEAHKGLNTQFQTRKVKKVYTALVLGCPEWDGKMVNLPLKTNAGRRNRTMVDYENGKVSVTQFSVLERYKDYSLIEAKPNTGRRHQVRVHLSHEGFPVACDSLYGKQSEIHRSEIDLHFPRGNYPGEQVLGRTALHASSIEFTHPSDNQRCMIEAPLASDMQLCLELLRS
jgi:RluA family pseudouridine synthase